MVENIKGKNNPAHGCHTGTSLEYMQHGIQESAAGEKANKTDPQICRRLVFRTEKTRMNTFDYINPPQMTADNKSICINAEMFEKFMNQIKAGVYNLENRAEEENDQIERLKELYQSALEIGEQRRTEIIQLRSELQSYKGGPQRSKNGEKNA